MMQSNLKRGGVGGRQLHAEAIREYLSGLVEASLAAGLNHTALFLAERLFALLSSHEHAVYLLALALHRNGLPQGVIYVLRSMVHPTNNNGKSGQQQQAPKPATRAYASMRQQQLQLLPAFQASVRSAWLYAQACNAVGRPREGSQVLSAAVSRDPASKAQSPLDPGQQTLPLPLNPSAATLQVHLAQLAVKSNKLDQAAQHYENALRECWWCYEAFEGLCHLGKAPNAYKSFGGSPASNNAAHSQKSTTTHSNGNGRRPLAAGPSQPTKQHSASSNQPSSPFPPTLSVSLDSSSASESSSFFNPRQPASNPPSSNTNGLYTPTQPFPGSSSAAAAGAGQPHLAAPLPNRRHQLLNKDVVRRSTRLTGPVSQNQTPSTTANPSALSHLDKAGKNKEPRSRVTSNPRERKRAKGSASPPAALIGASTNPSGSESLPADPQTWLKGVMTRFGAAESHLSMYDATGALDALLGLEVEQRRSWRACVGVGRARMESLDYAAAEKAFSAAREAAPYMLDFADVHSTLLWHLTRSTDLSYLAQQLMSLNPRAHQSWIASGNVFSLMDDHKNALKCFKRAIQLVEGPDLPSSHPGELGMQIQVHGTGEYAYVLAGHECVSLEEWESALGFYREALRRKTRTYTAWFGLGNVYMKTGKLRLAEYHFNRASEINPSNAMLVSCVGSVCEKLGKKVEALHLYERATVLAPASAAVCFKKCKLLVSMRRYQTALKDLLSLAALASDEWNVQFLLGKVYAALGQHTQMMKHFTFAQDLDPRSGHKIRAAIESANEKKERLKAAQQQQQSGMVDDANMQGDEDL